MLVMVMTVRRYLEAELARRYRDAAPATLALLQDRCAALAAELALAESRVNAIQDVATLRGEGACLLLLLIPEGGQSASTAFAKCGVSDANLSNSAKLYIEGRRLPVFKR